MNLTENFTLDEFQKASHATLTAAQIVRAKQLAQILQVPRELLKTRIVISSFVRTRNIGGGSHADGYAVDFYPLDVSMGRLFNWIAANQQHQFGRIIYERNHIHMTLPGPQPWAGHGVVLVEPKEGEYFQLLREAVAPIADALALPDYMRPWLPWAIMASIFLLLVAFA